MKHRIRHAEMVLHHHRQPFHSNDGFSDSNTRGRIGAIIRHQNDEIPLPIFGVFHDSPIQARTNLTVPAVFPSYILIIFLIDSIGHNNTAYPLMSLVYWVKNSKYEAVGDLKLSAIFYRASCFCIHIQAS